MAVDKAMLDEMYRFWKKWFNQSDEKKAEYKHGLHGSGGWYPPYSEGPGLEGNRDPKEYFHFRSNHFKMSHATTSVFLESYHKANKDLESLGMKHLQFPLENHVLRVIRYFATDTPGVVSEAHKDFNLLTIAYPGTQPGLEGRRSDGTFALIEPPPCGMSHKGEMMEILYPGKHKGFVHRASSNGQERYVAVFFYNPDLTLELRPGYTAKDYLNDTLTKAGTLGYKL